MTDEKRLMFGPKDGRQLIFERADEDAVVILNVPHESPRRYYMTKQDIDQFLRWLHG